MDLVAAIIRVQGNPARIQQSLSGTGMDKYQDILSADPKAGLIQRHSEDS